MDEKFFQILGRARTGLAPLSDEIGALKPGQVIDEALLKSQGAL